jgi:hypothetical protein
MCALAHVLSDYTQLINRSFVYKAKEWCHVRISYNLKILFITQFASIMLYLVEIL